MTYQNVVMNSSEMQKKKASQRTSVPDYTV